MKKLSLLILLILVTLSSCERIDYGDLNKDPFGVTNPNSDAFLRGAMMNYFTVSGRNYLTKPALYCQYQSQTQYTDEQRYNEAPGSWSAYYRSSLAPLKTVIETSVDTRGNTANLNATAQIMYAVVFKRITDTFGDIPYTDALQGGDNPNPVYDKQEDIYHDLISKVKEARDMFDDNAFTLDANTDLVYQGDISKWRKFANSMIMSMAIQLSNKYPSASDFAATAFNEALNNSFGVMESVSDDAIYTPDTSGSSATNYDFSNPWSQLRPADYRMSDEFTDSLQGETVVDPENRNRTSNHTYDNRLNFMVNDPTMDGLPYGYATYADYTAAQMNINLRSPGSPVKIFSSAYTYLNRAEAALLGWTSEDANQMLRNGIENSFMSWGATGGNSYATARLADATTEGLAKVIGEEKWVALYPSGFDAWAEQRRTGYPELLPSPDPFNNGTIPGRIPYPDDESASNPTNYNIGVQGLTPPEDKNSSKVWWDN